VKYDKQVIGTRNGFVAKIDSVQAIKNINKLIEESRNVSLDTVFTSVDKNVVVVKKVDSTLSVLSVVGIRE
jgi:arginine deiminase